MSDKIKNVYLIIGKSGSGKTTLVHKFMKKHSGYHEVESLTTRPPRYEGEKGHKFISESEFRKYKNNNQLVACSLYDSKYCYGATDDDIKDNSFYVIDKKGVEDMLNYVAINKDSYNLIIVYIKCNLFTRACRLIKRDGIKKAINRIINDVKAFKGVNKWQIDTINGGHKIFYMVKRLEEIITIRK